jgi:hypothetical protein
MGTRFDIMDLMMNGRSNIISTNGNRIPTAPKTSGERQKTFTTGVEDGSNDTTQKNYTEFNPLRSNE